MAGFDAGVFSAWVGQQTNGIDLGDVRRDRRVVRLFKSLATRVQPHRQVSVIGEIFRGSLIDPSMTDARRTSAMIVDVTRPLDRPFSPVSRCPDEALARIRLEDFIPREVLEAIPPDRTTYWC